jgi:co-chaperonin GroES (HSP10)
MIKPTPNWILVKPDFSATEKLGSLHLSTSYDNEKYAPTKGTVISVPDNLVSSFMDWETTMEVNPGDTVFFHYLTTINAVGIDNRTVEVNGETLFFIKYDSVFAILDSKTSAMKTANGYLLMEPIEVNDDLHFDSEILKFSKSLAKVVVDGSLNSKYRYNGYKDSDLIKKGDIVLLDKACNTFVCNPIYYGDKEQSYYRAQRTNVLAILQ